MFAINGIVYNYVIGVKLYLTKIQITIKLVLKVMKSDKKCFQIFNAYVSRIGWQKLNKEILYQPLASHK